MTRPTQLAMSLGAAILLVGCTDAASEHIASYESLVHDMEEENALHAANVESAADMDAVHAEEERYASAMGEMMHEMEELSESLDGCDGMSMGSSRMGMGYDSMSMMAEDMHTDMEDHSDAMEAADSMDDAHAMEDSYQSEMDERMHAMEDHGGEMEGSQMACE